MIENKAKAIELMSSIKAIGASLSLDDFRSGYSSINYLTLFPVDKVKLDKSFIDKYATQENQLIVKEVIDLIKAFDFKVLAEGVETQDQVDLLKALGCDYVQGYLYSKPLHQDQVSAYIQNHK